MAKVKGAMRAAALAACLPLVALPLAAVLSACSQSEPAPRDFILTAPPPAARGSKVPQTMEAATVACKEETRKKGIKSVAAIFSRLRPGEVDQDYISCMRERGYEVRQ